ncbi:hypothetical protein F4781DRAFT_418844 [Annulohypoxylon bovei var. microspora]|nr:hypothetical protein F4781DRAFT_418844 [Annulohypoxylon bovei var. microspora]
MAPANLITIPLEVLIEITSYLDTPSYGAVRLTCRGIEAALFRTFAHKYFRKITFMRTEYSLQALIDISKSRLSSYLQHVVISTQLLSPKQGFGVRRPPVDVRENGLVKFNRLCSDQVVLLDTSYDQQMLVEAFRNLNLQVIGIKEHAPCYVPGRDFSIYGISHIGRESGVDIRHDMSYHHNDQRKPNASCVLNVLLALGKSGSRPKRFEIESFYSRFDDDAFNIPSFIGKTIFPVLSNLEAIDIRVGSRVMGTFPGRLIGPMPDKLETYHIRKFLSESTQIKHLCLEQFRHFDGFFKWLTAPRLNESCGRFLGLEPAQPPAFSQLRELELGWFEVNLHDITAIVKKFSTTLRKLTLHDMGLILTDPPKSNYFDEWPKAVASLARSARCLQEVHFSRIAVEAGIVRRKLGFTDDKAGFSYAGPDMEKALGGIVDMLLDDEPQPYEDDEDGDDENLDISSGDEDLADFEEYLDYIDEYDDLIDGIDDGLAEDLMFQTIFGV